MSEFIVHTVPGSPFARSVMATLEEKRVPWRLAPLTPQKLREPAHLARNPFGRMPAVEHGDFTLYETQAIVRYIDRVWPQPALTPKDLRAAAQMDQAMNVSDWYLFQGCGNVIGFQRVVAPALLGTTPDEAAIAAAMPHARKVFAELSRLLGDKQYFAGDQLSLAEMMLIPQVDFLHQTPEWAELTAKLSNLVAWFDRASARPSFKATTWEGVAALAAAASA
ncbi:MAG TPA: glutathione S-transferase family protein [Steroidobacteraceae bacterium]|nr:glutathione S-transferase family protein [Steroidobacteraceae bacterium]